jgi:hypothetical protein
MEGLGVQDGGLQTPNAFLSSHEPETKPQLQEGVDGMERQETVDN